MHDKYRNICTCPRVWSLRILVSDSDMGGDGRISDSDMGGDGGVSDSDMGGDGGVSDIIIDSLLGFVYQS